MTQKQIKQQLITIIEAKKARSAWMRGVKEYAAEVLDSLDDVNNLLNNDDYKTINKKLLNGAPSWHDYSWGGSSLIYDEDIAARLCSPSELKLTRGGQRRPNRREEWLDVQARALYQASRAVYESIRQLKWYGAMDKQHD